MPYIAVLHDIRSEENVGSMFRTADAAGVQKMYLTGYTPAPLDEFKRKRSKVAKAALGAEESVLWEKKKSVTSLIDMLICEGYTVLALEQDKRSTPYSAVTYTDDEHTALIVGNEVTGLPEAVLKRVHRIVEIPMKGTKESLNVSVAFGVALYGMLRSE